MKSTLYTVGHSNHEMNTFIGLLRLHKITAVSDVRSHPYSRHVPQYSKDHLKVALATAGIAYVFLGEELGARTNNPACYRNGKVQYDLLAKEPCFERGIKRLIEGSEEYRIALMCAEKEPLDCHRSLLIARSLFESGVIINHIRADGSLETHQDLEKRLLNICKLPERDMFNGTDEFIAKAYAIQGNRIAYQIKTIEEVKKVAGA